MICHPPSWPALFRRVGAAVAAYFSAARAGALEFLGETLEAGLGEVRKLRLTDWKRSATGLGEVRHATANGLDQVRT